MDTTVGTVLRLEVKVRLLIGKKKLSEAENICQSILVGSKYDPRYGPALVLLAQIYLLQSRKSEARQAAVMADQWLRKRSEDGWTKKCREILEQSSSHYNYRAHPSLGFGFESGSEIRIA